MDCKLTGCQEGSTGTFYLGSIINSRAFQWNWLTVRILSAAIFLFFPSFWTDCNSSIKCRKLLISNLDFVISSKKTNKQPSQIGCICLMGRLKLGNTHRSSCFERSHAPLHSGVCKNKEESTKFSLLSSGCVSGQTVYRFTGRFSAPSFRIECDKSTIT